MAISNIKAQIPFVKLYLRKQQTQFVADIRKALGRNVTVKEAIGYCGLDCEKCDAYIATINDDQALREKTANPKLSLQLTFGH